MSKELKNASVFGYIFIYDEFECVLNEGGYVAGARRFMDLIDETLSMNFNRQNLRLHFALISKSITR